MSKDQLLDVVQFIIGDQDENIFPIDGKIKTLSEAVELKDSLEKDPENDLQSYTIWAEVSATKPIIRPFPIGKIKNTSLRRICIVLFYLPILAIGFVINTARGIYFLLKATKFGFTSLYESGKSCWDNPQKDNG